jgi:conserved oligomeric Golgi complex subunit 7
MEWQDAAGLAQLSQSVEDVFSSGNLPKAAETLATMRHCLSAVGEVLCFMCGLMHVYVYIHKLFI